LAPNKRNKKRLNGIFGKAELKNMAFKIYQQMRLTELPPFLYQSLLNLDKSVFNRVSSI
jgi:hypothetical protein